MKVRQRIRSFFRHHLVHDCGGGCCRGRRSPALSSSCFSPARLYGNTRTRPSSVERRATPCRPNSRLIRRRRTRASCVSSATSGVTSWAAALSSVKWVTSSTSLPPCSPPTSSRSTPTTCVQLVRPVSAATRRRSSPMTASVRSSTTQAMSTIRRRAFTSVEDGRRQQATGTRPRHSLAHREQSLLSAA